MVVSNIVTFLVSIVSLSVTGAGVWTPWWGSVSSGAFLNDNGGLYSSCVNGECTLIFAEENDPEIEIYVRFACGAASTVCLLIATVSIAVATLGRSNVKTYLRVATLFTILAILLLLITTIWFLISLNDAGRISTLSFSSYLACVGVGFATFQVYILLIRTKKTSADVAVV